MLFHSAKWRSQLSLLIPSTPFYFLPPWGTFFVNFFSRFTFFPRFTFGIRKMGKESRNSRGKCDFNGDKLVGNGKREITIFKIIKFSGNVIWETGFVKRNLRKMCPWGPCLNNVYGDLLKGSPQFCMPLLPGLACSIHATWDPPFSRALYKIFKNLVPLPLVTSAFRYPLPLLVQTSY